MRKLTSYSIFLGFLLPLLFAGCTGQSPFIKEIIPVEEGNFWKYQGVYNGKPAAIVMQVKEVYGSGSLSFAVMKGFPTDLMGEEENRSSLWGLLSTGNGHYFRVAADRIDSIKHCLADKESVHAGLVSDADLFLVALCGTGQVFGEAEQLTRSDSCYYWMVTEKMAYDPSAIRGMSILGPFDYYTLKYKTLADETSMDVVPGIGIVKYRYSHHGTPGDIELKLTEVMFKKKAGK